MSFGFPGPLRTTFEPKLICRRQEIAPDAATLAVHKNTQNAKYLLEKKSSSFFKNMSFQNLANLERAAQIWAP